jgi:hypothetical protein
MVERAQRGLPPAIVQQIKALNESAEHPVHIDIVKVELKAPASIEMVTAIDSVQRILLGVWFISAEVRRRN